jgi:hypothetical protein
VVVSAGFLAAGAAIAGVGVLAMLEGDLRFLARIIHSFAGDEAAEM